MNFVQHLIQNQPSSRRPYGFIIIEPPQNGVYRGALELQNDMRRARVYYLFCAPHPESPRSHELAVYADPQMEWPLLQTVVCPHPEDDEKINVECYIEQCLRSVIWPDGGRILFSVCNTIVCGEINNGLSQVMEEKPGASYYSRCFGHEVMREIEEIAQMTIDVMIQSVLYSIGQQARMLPK